MMVFAFYLPAGFVVNMLALLLSAFLLFPTFNLINEKVEKGKRFTMFCLIALWLSGFTSVCIDHFPRFSTIWTTVLIGGIGALIPILFHKKIREALLYSVGFVSLLVMVYYVASLPVEKELFWLIFHHLFFYILFALSVFTTSKGCLDAVDNMFKRDEISEL